MKDLTCEIEVTLQAIGGKWKPIILYLLIEDGVKRFSEIKSFIMHTSQKTLTNQLRELESDGLINRTVYPTVPPKVEYSITEKGKTLYPILEAMCDWGYKNSDDSIRFKKKMCE
ncbi:MAG: winged helix-turn-helix transcriptional regulator [Clostridium sp.]|uniref:winged helix-turn-helix transcriptional regulator n=1 Tax=Clostridium TaxID=1485 RepID=UPI00215282EE|nr:helix-turn-helix domain-containing protein [Clostridium sp. LY3-2]MCR6515557.1 helix-turn-helix transcriptional regulator [Clostridium sp. LY3-2]